MTCVVVQYMDESRVFEQIRESNSAKYGDGSEVSSYLTEPYHAMRMKLASDLLIRELIRVNPNTSTNALSVLELGSAGGEMAGSLARYGFAVTASDLAVPSDRNLRSIPNLQFIQLDASGPFPFVDCTFHAVYAGELIEHLFDTKLFLAECHRVLKVDGVLVLTTPNLATWQDRLGFLFGFSPRQVNSMHKYLRLHIRPFTAGSLRSALEGSGFRQKALLSNYVVLRFNSGKRLHCRWLARFWPTIGGSLIAAAQKDPTLIGT